MARDGKPVAKIVEFVQPRNRMAELFGDLKGKIWIADDFDEPISDELLQEWTRFPE